MASLVRPPHAALAALLLLAAFVSASAVDKGEPDKRPCCKKVRSARPSTGRPHAAPELPWLPQALDPAAQKLGSAASAALGMLKDLDNSFIELGCRPCGENDNMQFNTNIAVAHLPDHFLAPAEAETEDVFEEEWKKGMQEFKSDDRSPEEQAAEVWSHPRPCANDHEARPQAQANAAAKAKGPDALPAKIKKKLKTNTMLNRTEIMRISKKIQEERVKISVLGSRFARLVRVCVQLSSSPRDATGKAQALRSEDCRAAKAVGARAGGAAEEARQHQAGAAEAA
jgi:hypothetical protein